MTGATPLVEVTGPGAPVMPPLPEEVGCSPVVGAVCPEPDEFDGVPSPWPVDPESGWVVSSVVGAPLAAVDALVGAVVVPALWSVVVCAAPACPALPSVGAGWPAPSAVVALAGVADAAGPVVCDEADAWEEPCSDPFAGAALVVCAAEPLVAELLAWDPVAWDPFAWLVE
ncbi:hypothetical protein LQ327_15510 [Actinomycetospora endophytica]|uniref:Uncharacterized protein n=1 Tax=Actinomycetospora endophytica TaxID=2291215 RepID=A0ABS8P9K4_9PSEU|nr:hypothetical protein [Actinomycetospora endophytica]MCD2194779.1 hypothetical protein [Actinomycetospora endophytica]